MVSAIGHWQELYHPNGEFSAPRCEELEVIHNCNSYPKHSIDITWEATQERSPLGSAKAGARSSHVET